MADEEKEVVTPEVVEDDFGAGFEESASDKLSPETTSPEKEEKSEEVTEEAKQPEGENKQEKETPETKPAEETEEEGKEEFEKFVQEHQRLEDDVRKLQDENKSLQEKLQVQKPAEPPPPVVDLAKLAETNPTVKEFIEEYDYLAGPLQTIISEAVKGVKNNGEDSIKKQELQDLESRILHNVTIISARPEFVGLLKSGELKTFAEKYDGQDKDKVIQSYKEGTADDVIWLIDKLKSSKKPPADINLIKEDKEKKLKAMNIVEKKTTAINPKAKTMTDDSFEAGFEESAGKR